MDNTLYFERSNGERVVVGEPSTRREIFKMINEYTHKLNPNYKIYYTQITLGEDEICFDIGSHTEFYYIDAVRFKEIPEE